MFTLTSIDISALGLDQEFMDQEIKIITNLPEYKDFLERAVDIEAGVLLVIEEKNIISATLFPGAAFSDSDTGSLAAARRRRRPARLAQPRCIRGINCPGDRYGPPA